MREDAALGWLLGKLPEGSTANDLRARHTA
jgi:hypothetical protein